MNSPSLLYTLALRRLALSMAAVATAGCSQPASTAPTVNTPELPASISRSALADIESLIGDAACESDAQCRTIGIGHRPCGGPARYLAWSVLRTDEKTLQAAVAQHAAAQRREQVIDGRASTCEVVPDPGAYCDKRMAAASTTGVCRLQQSGGAGGPPAR